MLSSFFLVYRRHALVCVLLFLCVKESSSQLRPVENDQEDGSIHTLHDQIFSFDDGRKLQDLLVDLDGAGLKPEAPLSLQPIDGSTNGILVDHNGREYSIADAKPLVELFSPEDFLMSDDGKTVTDLNTEESFTVPVWRATYDDGTVLQVVFDDDTGDVSYAEIRHSNGSSDTFFVRTDRVEGDNVSSNTFLRFQLDDIDIAKLQTKYNYGDPGEPPRKTKGGEKKGMNHRKRQGKGKMKKRQMMNRKKAPVTKRNLLPAFVYKRGDGTSSECTYFKVVNLAIVYDADFCQSYSSFSAARSRIAAIVASASLYYERDMCVKLRLTNVYTPDNTCSAPSPTTSKFTRSKLCGGSLPHMLHDFSTWILKNRNSIGINPKSLVHLMTGARPSSGTLGCAWIGTFCWENWSYGVEHMVFSGSTVAVQSIILAHEVGHNLNAPHYESSSREYVMESRLSKATDGFSESSIDKILSLIDSKTCDDVFVQVNNNAPTPAPKPTAKPTAPAKPPSNNDDGSNDCCGVSRNTNEICIFEGKDDVYACASVEDLYSRLCMGCPSDSPSLILEECGGLPLLDARPALEDAISNDDPEPFSELPDYDEGGRNSGGVPKSFNSDSCSRSCTVYREYVCFLAMQNTVHSVTFSANDGSGKSERFKTDVYVKKKNKNSGDCYDAKTKCND